jgi:hypothetical protein
MSYTGAYTELKALDVEGGEQLDRNPRILDWDALVEWPETRGDIGTESFREMLVVDEWTDKDSYPTETWKILKGFKSWTPADQFQLDFDPDREALVEEIEKHRDWGEAPLGYVFNIERVAIKYNGHDGIWKPLFRAVSEATEPFSVYHSSTSSGFPDVTDFEDGKESVYYIEAVDGELYVEEQQFQHVGADRIVEDRDRVVGREGDDE